MRVIVTGSRNWTDREAIAFELGPLPRGTTIVHGDARGADRLAAEVARDMGFSVERHPADWELYGNAAGPKRNQLMVELGADLCLAFPMPGSKGTWDCASRAYEAGIPVKVVNPTKSDQVDAQEHP